jgi:hypothetical protein
LQENIIRCSARQRGQRIRATVSVCPHETVTDHEGESAFRVAAIKITLDHVLDDRPEIAMLPLEPALILAQEPVEMMEQNPVEDGPLWMSRAIDSRHGGRKASRNGPMSWIEPRLPGKRR